MIIFRALLLLALPALAPAASLADRAYFGFSQGIFYNDPSDIRALLGPGNSVSQGLGGANTLHLGFQSSFGFGLEGGYGSLGRQVKALPAGGSFEDRYIFHQRAYYLEPLYRRPFGNRYTWGAGLKLARTEHYLDIETSTGKIEPAFPSAYGYSLTPELMLQSVLGGIWGFEARLGYHLGDASPVEFNGAILRAAGGSGSDWHISNTGVSLSFGIHVYFGGALKE